MIFSLRQQLGLDLIIMSAKFEYFELRSLISIYKAFVYPKMLNNTESILLLLVGWNLLTRLNAQIGRILGGIRHAFNLLSACYFLICIQVTHTRRILSLFIIHRPRDLLCAMRARSPSRFAGEKDDTTNRGGSLLVVFANVVSTHVAADAVRNIATRHAAGGISEENGGTRISCRFGCNNNCVMQGFTEGFTRDTRSYSLDVISLYY